MDMNVQKLGASSQMNYVSKENGIRPKETDGKIPASRSDSIELSGKVAKKKPVTREVAVAIMEKIQDGLSNPEEGKTVYMPYVVKKNSRRNRSLVEAVNTLDRGESVYLNPMKWTKWIINYWDSEQKINFHLVNSNEDSTKISNFNELQDFYELEIGGKPEDLKPESVSSMPEPREIVKEFARLREEPPEEGKVIHIPYLENNKGNLKSTSFGKACMSLEKGEDVYIRPHTWTKWNYAYSSNWIKDKDWRYHLVPLGLKGDKSGKSVDTTYLSSLRDLQEYHKIWE